MPRVIIIGAGLTGLSAAYHLEQNGFYDYELYEKESSIGGLCRTITNNDYTFDFTGHLLHISDTYFHSLIQKLIGFDFFNTIHRQSYIYSHDRYTPYPYQMHLKSLPTHVIADCLLGFIHRKPLKKIKNFIDWVNHCFGEGFGRHFFIPYQKKIFACDLHDITATWTSRFVPQTTLEDIIDGLQGTTKNIGYNSSFLYPKEGGILSWVKQFASHIKKPIYTNTAITSVAMQKKIITISNNTDISYEYIINTTPLDNFLHQLHEQSNSFLKTACKKLKCNKVINFNLGIKDRIISDKHWIYFPEEKYPFYRLGFPHNFSSTTAPHGCSALYGEFAYFNQSKEHVAQTLKNALAKTKELFDITDSEIDTEVIIPISHAYVLYDRWRDRYLPMLLNRLRENNIHSVGRYGAWKYSSMQEAIIDGKNIADLICQQYGITLNHTHKGALEWSHISQ